MKSKRKFLSIFAILFALVFALSVCFFAACGSDDEKDDNTTTGQDENTGSGDTGSGDTGSGDTGSGDTGSGDTGSGDTGSGDTGSGDTGSGDTGSGDTESGDTGSGDTGSGNTGDNDKVEVSTAAELTAALSGTDKIVLGANISDAETTFTVASETTIDLAGYSITYAAAKGSAVFTVASTGSLTVEDSSDDQTGTISCTYTGVGSTDNAAAILTTGTLVLDGGTITSTSTGINAQGGDVTVNGATVDTTSGWWAIFENTGALADSNATAANVTVTINEGAVVKGNQKTIYLAGDYDGYSDVYNSTTVSKLVVNDGTITGASESAISTSGLTAKDCAVVEINGGTITGTATNKGPAVYVPNGILTITGGTISGSTAVEVRGGTTRISGGSFTSTYTGNPEATYTTSGATSVGYAIAVYPYTSTKRDSDSTFNNDADVTVSGGTFDGALYGNITRANDSFAITGGTFTKNPSAYVPETGYVVDSTTKSGKYIVETDSSIESYIVPMTENGLAIGSTGSNAYGSSFSSNSTVTSNSLFSITAGVAMRYSIGGTHDVKDDENNVIQSGVMNMQKEGYEVSFTDVFGIVHNPDQGIQMTSAIDAATAVGDDKDEYTYSSQKNVLTISASANIKLYLYVAVANDSFNSNRDGEIFYTIDEEDTQTVARTVSVRNDVGPIVIELTSGQTLKLGATNKSITPSTSSSQSTAKLWFFGAEAIPTVVA